MDPFHGSNQPFLHLLNSQQFPQDLNSHISLSQKNFTQESHHHQSTIPNRKEKRRLWTPPEDVVLCSAWLNTSKDAIVSNEQRNNTFWERVSAYVNASPTFKGEKCTTAGTCKQRWSKINVGVSKFVGAFEAATRNKRSGENDDIILTNAYKIYLDDIKKPFNLEHAWLCLRKDQKWCSSIPGNGEASSKRKPVNDEEAASIQVGEAAEPRPKGVKAAKNKNKKQKSESLPSSVSEKSLEAFQMMYALKEKDFALKKDFAKTNMLDNLLAKTEPLTELEIKLKDKLIEEMLNN